MARRRFFVDRVTSGGAELLGDEARHLARVLRAEAGQQFEISDNAEAYLAEIVAVQKDRVRFRVLSAIERAEPLPPLILLAALIKFDRFEWMIEKATELGVSRIVPFEAARTEPGLLAAAAKRIERWRKIARESSQQSRRVRMPEIEEACGLRQALKTPGADSTQHRFLLDENPGAPALMARLGCSTPSGCALLAGPEGGWKDSERAECMTAGWLPVSLGPLILRAETAAIAATALAMQASILSTDYTKR